MRNKHTAVIVVSFICLALFVPVPARAHCQIPCGIYDDDTRFVLLFEHITTIEKSMKTITELEADDHKNANQLVRWVNNKDEHADKLSDIVTDYFMAQRVKPVPAADKDAHAVYLKKLELLHGMIVTAMKCKQTTDPANVTALRKLVADFKTLYKK